MVFAYHRTQYGAGSSRLLVLTLGEPVRIFPAVECSSARWLPPVEGLRTLSGQQETQHQTGKKTTGKKGKGGNGIMAMPMIAPIKNPARALVW